MPLSHPFVERLIGTIRRECLDRTLFWTAADLEMKLLDSQRYYNGHRTHAGLDGRTPEPSVVAGCTGASVSSYRWAAALSWAVSDADGGVMRVRRICPGSLRTSRRVDPLNAVMRSVCMNISSGCGVEPTIWTRRDARSITKSV